MRNSSFHRASFLTPSFAFALVAVLLTCLLLGDVHAEGARSGGHEVTVCAIRASEQVSRTFVPPPAQFLNHQQDSSIFDITFIDFPAGGAEEAAVEYAAAIWSSLLVSPVPIRIEVIWTDLEGFRGRTNVRFEWNNGYPLTDTAYPPALGNALIGRDERPTVSEFEIRLSQDTNWYTGLDGKTGPDQLDLVTLVLHEIGHGLGLTTSIEVDTANSIGGWTNPFPSVLMRASEDAAGNIIPDFYPNSSVELGTVLQSENVFFNMPLSKMANNGERVRLFAPNPWEQGRSTVHIDQDTFAGALMSPRSVILGGAFHDPGSVMLAILEDLGWRVRKPERNVRLVQDKFVERGTSSAVAWIDYDDDGYLDLFVANGALEGEESVNHLYRNDHGQGFTLVTEGPIATDVNLAVNATWGDYDNDGLPDLFLPVRLGDNILYHNDGGGAFTRITTGEIVNDGGDSWCASWGDYDNDGLLDLFVANLDQANFLYRNNQDGTFTMVTSGEIVTEDAPSQSCAWGDYDNDGDLDLFVANSGTAVNLLYENQNGSFTKVTESIVVSEPSDSRGANWADYDSDGDLDLFVTNRRERNFLYSNNGNGTFSKVESGFVATHISSSRGSSWADFDNDGDLDLLVTNSGNESNLFYLNNGDATFTFDDRVMTIVAHRNSLGSAWGDFDRDGDLDLKIANYLEIVGIENELFVNENATGNNWINIECIGVVSNRSAIGTKVRVKATIGGNPVWQLNEISAQTGGGYGSQNSLNAEFGLGDATIVDSVRIEWPSGLTQILENLAVNQYLQVTEGQTPVSVDEHADAIPEELVLHQNYPNPFNPATTITFELPQSGLVELRIFNVLGEEVVTLLNRQMPEGQHSAQWDGADQDGGRVSSGVFLYRIRVGSHMQSRKMLLLR